MGCPECYRDRETVNPINQDEEMKRFFEEYELVDPLQPRDAFYRGRTNAAKLHHECRDGEEIRYALEYTARRRTPPSIY